jgi:hypothetical protein
MNRLVIPFAIFVAAISSPSTARSQETAPPVLDTALVSFFHGSWHCAGEFSNGKKIESAMTYTADLGNHWMRVTLDDVPPNGFHALSMWGADGDTGHMMSMIFDNFGGARKFTSAGWDGHKLVLDGAPGARRERFTYASESPSTYRMSWEVSGDAGATWKLGDALLCTRR